MMIAEFNRAVPGFGNEPRFFVGTEEVDPTELIPGQAYSIYPKRMVRPTENRAQLGGPAQPPRVEGPLIPIQWKVSDVNGAAFAHRAIAQFLRKSVYFSSSRFMCSQDIGFKEFRFSGEIITEQEQSWKSTKSRH
jgi:hypothetical protein